MKENMNQTKATNKYYCVPYVNLKEDEDEIYHLQRLIRESKLICKIIAKIVEQRGKEVKQLPDVHLPVKLREMIFLNIAHGQGAVK